MISKLRESLLVIIGIIMLAIFSSGLVLYIKKVKNTEVKSEQPVKQTETTAPTTEETKPVRIWRGTEYGLPAGVVVGGEQDDENPALNWLTIQQPDGHMIMVHNIDSRLWNAIEKGDIIE